MISFSDFITLKAKDVGGVGIQKTESAAIRKVIECIREEMIHIKSNAVKKILENVMSELMKRK